jgi:hypothetical protein
MIDALKILALKSDFKAMYKKGPTLEMKIGPLG